MAISYRQICIAYPSGGGSYTVSRRNIGRTVSLIAASALLIDYVMTVAVSTSSAVEQIVSAFPALYDERVLIGVAAIALIAIANLRGLREAGNIFAAPTYLFVGSALIMIAVGAFRIVVLGEGATYGDDDRQPRCRARPSRSAILLLLRAFAAGAVALTGTEAIATGVPAFKPPEAKNAATTLAVMAALLATLFIGITFLAVNFAILPIEFPEKKTVIAQVAQTVYGDGALFYLFQAFTALLLFLAANTSFNAFPRLLAILAGDGHMPRQFALRGDRLAFSYGIIVLASLAAGLIIIFQGSTHLLIPLYAVGVFIDFTISQTGMIRHWLRERSPGYRRRLAINAFGATLTGIVAVIVTAVKFWDGAWIVLVLIPILVAMMSFIGRQYDGQEEELRVREDGVLPGPHREQRVIVPVNGINRAVVQAVNFGAGDRPRPARRLRDRRPRGGRRPAQALGTPAPGRAAGHRRIAIPGGHLAGRRLPRHPRPGLAAGQGGARDDRRPARVRGASLVGSGPLQPDGQATQGGAGRARAHGHRRRPVPARSLTDAPPQVDLGRRTPTVPTSDGPRAVPVVS